MCPRVLVPPPGWPLSGMEPRALMAAIRNRRETPPLSDLSPRAPTQPTIAVGVPLVLGVPLVSTPAIHGRLPALTTVPVAAASSSPDAAEDDVLRPEPQAPTRRWVRVPVRTQLPELQAQLPTQPGGSSLQAADGEIRHGSRVRTRRLQTLNKFMRPQPGRWGPWSHGRIGALNTFYNQV